MKTHLKALLITFLVFAAFVCAYYLFSSGKPKTDAPIAKAASVLSLPQNDFVTLNDKTINLKEFAGKVIIFNFWASWCAPCIEEVPSLVTLVKADPNIVIIAVSGDEHKDDIEAFLKSFPDFNKSPIYVVQENAKAMMEYFNVERLPESFIFNDKGEMVKKITGTINWHTPDSIEYFKSLRK